MLKLLERIKSTTGKTLAVLCSIVLLLVAVAVVWSSVRGDVPGTAYTRMYMCTETGKPFPHTNKAGEGVPIYSPYSKRDTGVPAESCYWTADGQVAKQPTYVLLNSLAGKPEPTFCPDCGRLVVGHNPPPGPNVKAPPTPKEYAARDASRTRTRDER